MKGNFKVEGVEIAYQDCPYCKNDRYNFSVNPRKGVWKCWACGKAGKIKESPLYGMKDLAWIYELGKEEKEEPMLPPLPGYVNKNERNADADEYLESRGISVHNAMVLGMYPSGQHIIIPFKDQTGRLVYWQGRKFTGDGPKYYNPPGIKPALYRLSPGIKPQSTFMVEGVFDAIALYNNGYQAIAICGKRLNEAQEKQLRNTKFDGNPIYICLDPDAKLTEVLFLKSQLQQQGLISRIVSLPEGMGDVADIVNNHIDIFKEAIDNAF